MVRGEGVAFASNTGVNAVNAGAEAQFWSKPTSWMDHRTIA